MPNIPGPTGGGGPTGAGPPPNPDPTAEDVAGVLSVEEAWHKLNYGIGKTNADLTKDGMYILNRLDRKIGLKSK